MKPSLAVLAGALSISVFACASDPNKRVNEAQTDELRAERKAQENAAEARRDRTDDQAEAQRKYTVESGHGDAAEHKRLKADAKMTEYREKELARANERLAKADAKTDELRAIVNKAGGNATTQARDSLVAVDRQRLNAKMSIDQMANAPDDQLKQTKDAADGQLDVLEGYVKQASKDVDKFK